MAKPETKPSKRRVKNPDSFREKALKAKAEEQQTNRSKLALVLKNALKPVVTVIRLFFKLKLVRLITKIIFPKYFRKSFTELKLVTWPTLKQSRQLTFAVIIFAVLFGASVALLDLGLDKIFRSILLK